MTDLIDLLGEVEQQHSDPVVSNDEIRNEISQLRRSLSMAAKMVYVHGAAGGFDLSEHDQGGAESGVSFLYMLFLGDAKKVRDLYWDSDGDTILPGCFTHCLAVLDIALRAFGEAVFIDNTWSSLIMLVCLLIQDWFSALMTCAFLVILSTFTVVTAVFPRQAVVKSLYHYNTVLVTIAMCIFAHDTAASTPITFVNFVSVCIGNGINFLCVCFFRMSDSLAPYTTTFPFNIASIAFLIAGNGVSFKTLKFSSGVVVREAPLLQLLTPSRDKQALSTFEALAMSVPNGFGQVYFVDSWPLGLVMLLSCAIHSPSLAAFAFVGALSGSLFALVFSADQSAIADGLWGFNGVLISMLAGLTWVQGEAQSKLSWNIQRFAIATSLSLVTVFVTAIERFIFSNKLGVPAFTLPFCTVAVLYISILSSPMLKKTATLMQSDRNASLAENEALREKRILRKALRRSESSEGMEMKRSASLLRFRNHQRGVSRNSKVRVRQQ